MYARFKNESSHPWNIPRVLQAQFFSKGLQTLFFKKNACFQNGQIWSNILPETMVG